MKRYKKIYVFRKFEEYFFSKIDEALLSEAMGKLDEREKAIFESMSKYDRFHSLEVYEKVKRTRIGEKEIYLKLALLHDCGKEKTGIIKRVLHKMGLRTSLREHGKAGGEKLRGINEELAELIDKHHVKNYSEEMSVFQECDDES